MLYIKKYTKTTKLVSPCVAAFYSKEHYSAQIQLKLGFPESLQIMDQSRIRPKFIKLEVTTTVEILPPCYNLNLVAPRLIKGSGHYWYLCPIFVSNVMVSSVVE